MLKKILNILFIVFILFGNIGFTYAVNNYKTDLGIETRESTNDVLDKFNEKEQFFKVESGTKGLTGLILNIARDARMVIYAFIGIFVVVMVIRLLFSENTEEQQKKMKSSILWSTVGIMVMQIAFSASSLLFDKDVNSELAKNFSKQIVEPFTNLLMYLSSFVFIVIAIIAFYHLVTAGGNDESVKKGRKTIINAIIGIFIIKVSKVIVDNTLNPDCSGGSVITSFGGAQVCSDIKENVQIVYTLVNWFNTFLGLVVLLMILYGGFLIVTGGGDEEKAKKSKKIFIYSFIGLLILFTSYIILNFFIKRV